MTAIPQYTSKNIQVLRGLSGIKKSFTMYAGGKGLSAQKQMVSEGVDNAIDEHELLKHNKPIEVLYCFRDGKYQFIIKDRGRGIPIPSLRDVTSEPHSSGKFEIEGEAYDASIGTHGLGLKLIMATSKNAMVLSSWHDELAFIRYCNIDEKGYKTGYNVSGRDTGVYLIADLDPTLFDNMDKYETDPEGLIAFLDRLKFTCVFVDNIDIRVSQYDRWINIDNLSNLMMKEGNSVALGFEAIDNIKVKEDIFVRDPNLTLEKFIREVFETNIPKAWEITQLKKDFNKKDKSDRISYDIKLFLTENLRVNKGGVMATLNSIQMNDAQSHHIFVISESIKDMVDKYIEDIEIKSFFKSSYKLPLYYIARVKYKGADFDDQTKKSFRDANFSRMYKTHLLTQFKQLGETHWEDLYNLLKEDIEKKFRDSFSNKYTSGTKGLKNIELDLEKPKSYQGCISTDKNICELYIVEGQSAKGNTSQAANPFNQAIFCIEGKPINGVRCSDAEFFADLYVRDLMKILNVSPKDITLNNMNFHHIYILADADHHGLHICCLIIGNLYRINPLIITEGRVSLSNPPLYSLAVKDGLLYLKDFDAIMETKVKGLYQTAFDIEVTMGNVTTPSALSDKAYLDFCYIVKYFNELITKASSSIGTDAYYVEVMLKHLNEDHGSFSLDIAAAQACLQASKIVTKDDYLIITSGEVDLPFPWVRFIAECKKYLFYEYSCFPFKMMNVFVTTKLTDYFKRTPIAIVTLAELMTDLDKHLGKIGHFKGLGEMKPFQLRETCFDPTTKSSITLRNIGDVHKVYGMLGVDSTQRKNLVSGR